MSIWLKSGHSLARPPLLIYRDVGHLRKPHYGSNASDLMSWQYNDMINTLMTFSFNRITLRMKTEVKRLWSRHRHFHWIVHWVTRNWPVMGFLQFLHFAAYKYRGAIERSNINQIEILLTRRSTTFNQIASYKLPVFWTSWHSNLRCSLQLVCFTFLRFPRRST